MQICRRQRCDRGGKTSGALFIGCKHVAFSLIHSFSSLCSTLPRSFLTLSRRLMNNIRLGVTRRSMLLLKYIAVAKQNRFPHAHWPAHLQQSLRLSRLKTRFFRHYMVVRERRAFVHSLVHPPFEDEVKDQMYTISTYVHAIYALDNQSVTMPISMMFMRVMMLPTAVPRRACGCYYYGPALLLRRPLLLSWENDWLHDAPTRGEKSTSEAAGSQRRLSTGPLMLSS